MRMVGGGIGKKAYTIFVEGKIPMKRMTIAILSITAITWQFCCLAGDATNPAPRTGMAAAQATNRVDITTQDGQVFKNCKITKVEPDGITVFYAQGVVKINFTNLPAEYRTKYGYDQEKAEAYSRMVDEKRAAATEPVIGNGFVGTPEFDTHSGKFSAGTAFFAKVQGEANPLLITAQHIFGPAGGLNADVPREQMAGFSKRVTLHDFASRKDITAKINSIALPDSVDVAAFRTDLGTRVTAHPFAKENPKKGDIIWLVAALADQADMQILHRGSVVEVWDDKIKCKFDNGNLVMRGASGAPYLNAHGEIVGLHTGSFKDPGHVAGALIPVETIINAIYATSGNATGKGEQKK
jgi:hypothetical protein